MSLRWESTFRRTIKCVSATLQTSQAWAKDKFSQTKYHKWCEKNKFLSMLPEDTAARREDAANGSQGVKQTSIATASKDAPVAIRYSNSLFARKCLVWAITTDQVCAFDVSNWSHLNPCYKSLRCFDEPSYRDMIYCASTATKKTVIPSQKLARTEILVMVEEEMLRLKKELHVCFVLVKQAPSPLTLIVYRVPIARDWSLQLVMPGKH